MTHTMQSCSRAFLNETGKEPVIHKPLTEDNLRLLSSVHDGLNTLCEKLSSLDCVLKKIKLELTEKEHKINKENT